MSLSFDLLGHAAHLLDILNQPQSDVSRRRAVSASYYALFHKINEDAANLIAPNVSAATNHRIQRWFSHSEMKRVCTHFTAAKLAPPLLGLIGQTASLPLRTVAQSFIQLQEARHSADYDLSYSLSGREARSYWQMADAAIEAWGRIADSAEANIFILSLLLWKNWEKDRL